MKQEQYEPRVCPKTGKIIGAKPQSNWKKWLFPITGLISLLWFLIRVVPKPSRARYPCQQAAMPLASGFVIWLLSIAGFGAAVAKARKHFRQSHWLALGLCVVIAVVGIFGALNIPGKSVNAAFTFPDKPNTPVGVAKGIYPGRVTFLRDARACTYNNSGNYWDDAYVNQAVIDSMISKSLQSLTGKSTDSEAWDALFKFYNQNKSGQSIGYQAGEKINIKVNNNVDTSGTNIGKLHANTPQMLYGLVKQLLSIGVKGANITIIDSSRYMGSQIVDKFANDSNPEIKAVRFVAKGRINPTGDMSQPIYFSGGSIPNAGVPTDYTQGKYMINCALLRPHAAFGITLCGKNNFGSTYFPNNGGFTPAPMHTAGMAATYGKYSPIVDLMGHNQLGGKTLLYMIDGIYGCRNNQDNVMQYPSMGGWPACILTSLDPVAIDSVCADFLANESSVSIGASANAPDDYLHEAAQANNPPSGTVYDPNHTGRLASLGVHEHWNNATDKKYTRNLGTGSGIELFTINPSQTTPTPTVRTATPTRIVTPTPTLRGPTPTPTRRSVATATPTPTVGTATPTPTTRGTGSYVVSYVIQSDWGNGATINVTIKNNSTAAVNGWTLAFSFPGNQTIANLWNGTYTQSGASVSVKDAGFNANIPANGGSTNFGFNLNYSGTNAKPTAFTLNGTACTVQ
ncbi:MAG TPA: cellulose binding domain-containing protein [Bacillota bacterium]|nr:cellulose binding domain-containing protein [Bacillota bacterium]